MGCAMETMREPTMLGACQTAQLESIARFDHGLSLEKRFAQLMSQRQVLKMQSHQYDQAIDERMARVGASGNA